MGHSKRSLQFKNIYTNNENIYFPFHSFFLTSYSSPVPDPEPQYYEDYDYNNNGAGGGRFQGGNGGRFQGGNGGRRNGGGQGSNGSQDCEYSQCHQNYPKGGIGGGVAGGNNQRCVGSQCQQNFDGKDHSNFFTDSFWDRKRNGRNR